MLLSRFFTAFLALVLLLCGGSSHDSWAGSPKPTHLAVAWLPSANQAHFYWALDRGYYKEEGLDVTIVHGRGSGVTVQQVGSGQYEIGQADLSTMLLAVGKGAKLRAFMSQTNRGTFGLHVGKDVGAKSWRDLYGKTVLVSAGSPETFLLRAVFGKLGLDLGKVNIVNASPSNKVANFLAGKADASGGGLPGSMAIIDRMRPSEHWWFADVINTVDLGYLARQEFIDANPDVIRKFVRATRRATEELLEKPELGYKAVDAMIARNPNSGLENQREKLRLAWDDYRQVMSGTEGKPLGWINPERIQATIDVLRRYAGLQLSVAAESVFTNRFVEE